NRDALIDIISMAQQASPNDMGQMEFLRPQLMALSSVVNSTPSEAAAAALSVAPLSIRANNSAGPLAKGVSMPSFSHGMFAKIGFSRPARNERQVYSDYLEAIFLYFE